MMGQNMSKPHHILVDEHPQILWGAQKDAKAKKPIAIETTGNTMSKCGGSYKESVQK